MSTTHDPLAWIDAALTDLERRDLRRPPATRSGPQSARISIDGRELINFSSNDYLGLASDERLSGSRSNCRRARRLGQRRQPAGQRPQRFACRFGTPPRRIRGH